MTEDYLPELYGTKEWFESLKWQQRWIGFMVGWWVGQFGLPESVLDFGCGDGWWLKCFHDMGAKVTCGVELHNIANEFVPNCSQLFIHDLRTPLDLGKKADLVICLEVMEHLTKTDADVLCQTLVNHMKGVLLLSAAGLGQKGTGHISLHPIEYWVNRIEIQGHVKFSAYATGLTQAAFKNIVNECFEFLPRNVMVFAIN